MIRDNNNKQLMPVVIVLHSPYLDCFISCQHKLEVANYAMTPRIPWPLTLPNYHNIGTIVVIKEGSFITDLS